jgi:hypothetical protein
MSANETPDWSNDNVIKFIEMIRDNQLLWNPNHGCYKTNSSYKEWTH